MRCATCGEDLREGAKFCPTCGTPTASGAAPVAQTVRIARNPPPDVTAPAAPAPPTPPSSHAQAASTMATPPPVPTAPHGAAEAAYERAPGVGAAPPSAPPRGASGDEPTQGDLPTPRFQASTPPRPPFVPPTAAGLGGAADGPRPGSGVAVGALGKPGGQDFGRLGNRLVRLLKLDTSAFGEVYRDKNATIPVAVFVAAVMVLSALGGYLFIDGTIGFDLYSGQGFRDLGLPGTQLSRSFGPSAGEFILRSMIIGTLLAGAMLVAWAFITQLLLKQLGKVQADPIGLVRVLGLSLAPFVFGLLLFITDTARGLGWLVMGAVAALATVAVLESEEVRPGPALIATLAGFFAFVIVLTFLGQSTRDWAPGFFAVG